MDKKIFAKLCIFSPIIVLIIFVTTACSLHSNSDSTDISYSSFSITSEPEDNPDTEISCLSDSDNTLTAHMSTEEIISAYCNGTWDGNSSYNGEYKIQDGLLLKGTVKTRIIPDMGPFVNEYLLYSVIGTIDTKGTLIYDGQTNCLEWWLKGYRLKKLKLPEDYYSQIFKYENIILTKNGSKVSIYNLEFELVRSLENIVDFCYKPEIHQVFLSNFERENFQLSTLDAELSVIQSHIVRFNRGQSTDPQISAANCYIKRSSGKTYYIDTENMKFFEYSQNYTDKKLIAQLPSGVGADIAWKSENNFVISIFNEDKYTICIVRETGDIDIVSTSALDYNVAYDTLYFMEGSTVYSVNWETDSHPYVYFEGAYAVSPHIDEAEGALVPLPQANYQAYGFENIFSPYGQ